MRIKHSGQRTLCNPKQDAGAFFAQQAKRVYAAAMCGGRQPPIYMPVTPVKVTFRNKRRVVTPSAA